MRLLARFLAVALLAPSVGAAQLLSGWSGKAGASLVNSSGNSSAGSLGLRVETGRDYRGWLVSVDTGALRSSTDTVRRDAIGTADDFEIVRSVTQQVQADRTWLRARIANGEDGGAGGAAWFATAGWERDAPAGIQSRFELAAGVGAAFGDGEEPPLFLGGGVTVVGQRDEVRDPGTAGTTVGLRLDVRAKRTVGRVDLSLVSSGVWNLRTRDDLRLDTTGSASVPISDALAFQPSLQALWDSRPSLVLAPLAPAVGASSVGTVTTPRARLDLILLASLTIQWGES